jgi:hypothetical protein
MEVYIYIYIYNDLGTEYFGSSLQSLYMEVPEIDLAVILDSEDTINSLSFIRINTKKACR